VAADRAEMMILNKAAIPEPSALLADIAPRSTAAMGVDDAGEPHDSQDIPAALLGLSRIRYAAAASLVSKASSIALQVIAVPVAIRWLGIDQYAAYVVATSALAWISAVNLGLPQAIAITLPGAIARRSEGQAGRSFRAALQAMSIIVAIAVASTFVFAQISPLAWKARGATIDTLAFMLLLAANAGHVILSLVESAQAAYQELYFYNLFLALGSCLALISILAVSHLTPSIWLAVAALNCMPLLARGVNAARFLYGHPYLLTAKPSVGWSECVRLLRVGASYFLTSVASYVVNRFIIVQVAASTSSRDTTVFAAAMSAYTMGFSVVTMLTVPLLPAVALHHAIGDFKWIRAIRTRMAAAGACFGVVTIGVMVALGPALFRSWLRGVAEPSRLFCAGFGVYFALSVLEHIYYQFLIGGGQTWRPGLAFAVRSALVLLLALRSAHFAALEGVIGLMCLSIVAITLPAFICLEKARNARAATRNGVVTCV
jgi:O-antigen/teichoic acid export membrane protein